MDYDEHSALLYKRAREAVDAIRAYQPDDEKLHGLVAFHARDIARKVAAHLRLHRHERPAGYEPVVKEGWSTPTGRSRTGLHDEPIASYRAPVTNKARIRQMRFGGFKRCLFPEVQFESDGERRLSVLLEDAEERSVRWFRLGKQDLSIYWSSDRQYIPDFIVETATHRLIVEIKDTEQVDDADVQAKARAAAEWCTHASAHASEHGGKPWVYPLVPDAAVLHTTTIEGLVSRFCIA